MAPGPRPEAHYHTLWCDLRPQAHRHPFQARCPSGGRRGPGQSQTFLGRVRGGPPGPAGRSSTLTPCSREHKAWEGVGVKAGSTRGLSKGASGRRGGVEGGSSLARPVGVVQGERGRQASRETGAGLPLEIAARALLREIQSLQYGACNTPAPGQQKRMAGSRPPAPGVQDADSPT